MATKHYVLRLTDLEARCLSIAAGEVLMFEDAMESVFPEPERKRAAERAYEKLNTTIYKTDNRQALHDE